MKRRKITIELLWFLIFFLIISTITTISILLYEYIKRNTNNNILIISLCLIGNILFGAILFAIINSIRWKILNERYINDILDATNLIAKGNFNISFNIKKKKEYYTEYDYILENINIMAAELRKNEVLKEDFISNFSHEIKTPLQIIKNYITLLQDKNITEDEKKDYLNNLIITTNKLSTLITNILKLNKLDHELKIDTKEIDLSEELRLSIISFVEIIDKNNINLNLDIDDNILLKSNQGYLEIIFNNLISNAIKFTKDSITISLKKENNIVIFSVLDNGIGMNSDVGNHIFDRFYQGDTSHKSEGNGLGLALVKKVIDLMGGEIYLKSQLNVGTEFKIILGDINGE